MTDVIGSPLTRSDLNRDWNETGDCPRDGNLYWVACYQWSIGECVMLAYADPSGIWNFPIGALDDAFVERSSKEPWPKVVAYSKTPVSTPEYAFDPEGVKP